MTSTSKRFRGSLTLAFSALAILFVAAVPAAAQQAGATPPPRPNVAPPLKITISAFPDGAAIPLQYTCAATTPPPSGPMHISLGVSPRIQWTNVPQGTASFVLILHDGDAHIGKAFIDIRTGWSSIFPAMPPSFPKACRPTRRSRTAQTRETT